MVMGNIAQQCDVAVVGAGPGGYVAALAAADLGLDVALIEVRNRRGGVCLLEGCIPSKALISTVELAHSAKLAQKKMGLSFDKMQIDHKQLRKYAEGVIGGLTGGIDALLKNRGVAVIEGYARFSDANTLKLEGSDVSAVTFKHCILACGSHVTQLPMWEGQDVWT